MSGRYPPEYRQQLVDLIRSGRSADSLGREFEPAAQTIRALGLPAWVSLVAGVAALMVLVRLRAGPAGPKD